MTIGELFEGAYRRGWSEKRINKLRVEIRTYLVIPYSPRVLELYGHIRAERKHQPIAVDDALIAATALAHDCPLVTHNPEDFSDISGLRIITEH
jgi:tRNA(fMet)-specific endonuclease VapC